MYIYGIYFLLVYVYTCHVWLYVYMYIYLHCYYYQNYIQKNIINLCDYKLLISFAGFPCPHAREDLPRYSIKDNRQLNGRKLTPVSPMSLSVQSIPPALSLGLLHLTYSRIILKESFLFFQHSTGKFWISSAKWQRVSKPVSFGPTQSKEP